MRIFISPHAHREVVLILRPKTHGTCGQKIPMGIESFKTAQNSWALDGFFDLKLKIFDIILNFYCFHGILVCCNEQHVKKM